MDEIQLGKRILTERKKRGLTQESVEKRIGLPLKAMTRIESGERGPSTLELAKLADLFHMPIGDFLREEIQDEDPLIALHRAAPGLEHDPVIQEEVRRCVYLCKEGVNLEKLLEQPSRQRLLFSFSAHPQSPLEAVRQGERAAKEERRRIGIGEGALRNVVELLAAQGVWCAATNLPQEMSGLFLYKSSVGMVILVNASHSNSRQNFSYAHEYAHALFDANHAVLISENANSSDLIETRANAFAAAFLMPEEGIAEVMYTFNKGFVSRASIVDNSGLGTFETEQRQLARKQKLSPQDASWIAHRFGVSYQAAVYRLYNLRYLSQKERVELLEEESQGRDYLRLFGIEDSEKKEKHPSSQRELDSYISRLVIEAYRQEKISRGRVIELSKLLRLPPQALIELANINNE